MRERREVGDRKRRQRAHARVRKSIATHRPCCARDTELRAASTQSPTTMDWLKNAAAAAQAAAADAAAQAQAAAADAAAQAQAAAVRRRRDVRCAVRGGGAGGSRRGCEEPAGAGAARRGAGPLSGRAAGPAGERRRHPGLLWRRLQADAGGGDAVGAGRERPARRDARCERPPRRRRRLVPVDRAAGGGAVGRRAADAGAKGRADGGDDRRAARADLKAKLERRRSGGRRRRSARRRRCAAS